jgi:chromosome segregation ATPase
MRLSHITLQGFKSFAKKTSIDVTHQVTGVVGPNGSGKSNIAEAIRFVLGEQSMKSMRSKSGADVIFKGSEHLSPLSRATVTMVIDNKDKNTTALPVSQDLASYLVYDELILSRTIYADGGSDYTLNDAKIRLKDVQELLSFSGIGGSAYTIINQGEADKILLASPKERKEALEDALGLRVFHLRLHESKKKLEKVRTHVHEVELLRKEIKPHLEHLKRQVDKIASQEEERKKLYRLLIAYLHREDKELLLFKERLSEQGSSASLLLVQDTIEKELKSIADKKANIPQEKTEVQAEKERIQAELRLLFERKDQTAKTLGRIEAEKKYIERERDSYVTVSSSTIAHSDLRTTYTTLQHGFESLTRSLDVPDVAKAVIVAEEISATVSAFFTQHTQEDISRKDILDEQYKELEQELIHHEGIRQKTLADIAKVETEKQLLETRATESLTSKHEEEKKIVMLEGKIRELESLISLRRQEEGELVLRTTAYNALLEEGVIIVGRQLLSYRDSIPDMSYAQLKKQDLMRAIERSKLRIEEAGVPNKDEILEEYSTTKEREEYLVKELKDIQESEEKLLSLIDELTSTLSERFAYGVDEVSKIFSDFFGEVFVGGKAKLSRVVLKKITEEGDEISEDGIELDVNLPNKKVKEIGMFSGGERALVSIALLFAMSAITPPPFMVLDETDAPLDESNARKYGAMLKRLSERSKLLIITHNRETMNHCDMLYGVTLGVDGGSKLLSINLKQAEGMVD